MIQKAANILSKIKLPSQVYTIALSSVLHNYARKMNDKVLFSRVFNLVRIIAFVRRKLRRERSGRLYRDL